MMRDHEQATIPRAAVVLDPHPICQEGVRALLATLEIEVVGTSRTPSGALALVGDCTPDLLVAEIETAAGPADGVACIRAARERHSDLAIVVLSNRSEPAVVTAAMVAGATAYVPKNAASNEVAAEIRRALAPAIYLVSEVAAGLDGDTEAIGRRTVPIRTGESTVARLTRRELEVLRLVDGRSNRQVAKLLWVTDETVKFHLANIYRKLGVSSRSEAVAYARRAGLLDDGETLDYAELAGAPLSLSGGWGTRRG